MQQELLYDIIFSSLIGKYFKKKGEESSVPQNVYEILELREEYFVTVDAINGGFGPVIPLKESKNYVELSKEELGSLEKKLRKNAEKEGEKRKKYRGWF